MIYLDLSLNVSLVVMVFLYKIYYKGNYEPKYSFLVPTETNHASCFEMSGLVHNIQLHNHI